MNMDKEWTLISFGNGTFKDSILKPKLFQLCGTNNNTNSTTSSPIHIFGDQAVIVGIEAVPHANFVGDAELFATHFEQNLDLITLKHNIFLNNSSEDISLDVSHLKSDNSRSLQFARSPNGVFLYFNTFLKVSPIYMERPLDLVLTLSLSLGNHRAVTHRVKMDEHESNVRLLLDLNRYRPPRIPLRKQQLSVIINHPVRITTSATPDDALSSWLTVNVTNTHQSKLVVCNDLRVHLDRTAHPVNPQNSGDADNYSSDEEGGVTGTDQKTSPAHQYLTVSPALVKLLSCVMLPHHHRSSNSSSTRTASSDGEVVISPQESFSFVYRVTCSDLFYRTTDNTTFSSSGSYSTPVSLHWRFQDSHEPSTESRGETTDGAGNTAEGGGNDKWLAALLLSHSNSMHSCEVPLEQRVGWTLGRAAVQQASNNSTGVSLLFGAQQSQQQQRSGPVGVVAPWVNLSVVGGPTEVRLGETFSLRVSVTNNSRQKVCAGPVVITDRAHIPLGTLTAQWLSSFDLGDAYIITQAVSPLSRDIMPGETAEVSLTVTAIQTGLLSIGNIFLSCSSGSATDTAGSTSAGSSAGYNKAAAVELFCVANPFRALVR